MHIHDRHCLWSTSKKHDKRKTDIIKIGKLDWRERIHKHLCLSTMFEDGFQSLLCIRHCGVTVASLCSQLSRRRHRWVCNELPKMLSSVTWLRRDYMKKCVFGITWCIAKYVTWVTCSLSLSLSHDLGDFRPTISFQTKSLFYVCERVIDKTRL